MEALHYKEKDYRFGCWWCGVPFHGEDYDEHSLRISPSHTLWANAPDSCRKLNPVTLDIFNEDGRTTGFRFDEDAVQISEGHLNVCLKQFTPLVMREGKLWTIKAVDPRKVAFSWSPVLKKKVKILDTILVTPTYHSCAYYGFFKPSVAEVLAQIPDDVKDANAFWIESESMRICQDGDGQIAKTHWVKI